MLFLNVPVDAGAFSMVSRQINADASFKACSMPLWM
jgi:hypothetical protein